MLSMMTLITGFTCPPTIYFKFITKCDDYYKVRQNIWLYVEVSFSPLFSLLLICPLITFPLFSPSLSNVIVVCFLDCKAVRIFAYSSTCKQSNKSSGTRLKPRARLGIAAKNTYFPLSSLPLYGLLRIAHFARVRLLSHTLPISLTVLQSICLLLRFGGVPAVPSRKQSVMKKCCHLIHSFI